MNRISWWRTDFGEEVIENVKNSIKNENISQGKITEQFETQLADYLNSPFVVATTSGSTALLMSMMALGIGPGDEVIIPNRTWIATAHAPLILGAKPVLVDVLSDKPMIDVTKIREKINSKTKAIMPVHLNGRGVDMEEINKIAQEHNLFVIEDACQAFASKNPKGFLGTQSDIGCFSLGVTKLISSGQGGVIVTKNRDTYEKLNLIRNNGVVSNLNPKYKIIGSNFKFTDIQASIGIAQLSKIKDKVMNIKKIYSKYIRAIDTLESMSYLKMVPVKVTEDELPIYIEVLCNEGEKLINYLNANNIEARSFLPSLDSAPYIENIDEFPNSKVFSEQGIFLPSGPSQPLEDVDRVIEVLKKYKSNN